MASDSSKPHSIMSRRAAEAYPVSDSSEYLPSEGRGLQPHCTAVEWETLQTGASADWSLDGALTSFHFCLLHLLLSFQLPMEKRGSPKGVHRRRPEEEKNVNMLVKTYFVIAI